MDPRSSSFNELTASTMVHSQLAAEGAARRLPALTILAHPNLHRVGERVVLPALVSGRPVLLSRTEPLFAPPGGGAEQPLSDPHLSRSPLRLHGAGHGAEGGFTIDRGEVGAAIDVDGVALVARRRLSAEELNRGVVLTLAERVALLLHLVEPLSSDREPRFGLVGESDAMAQLRRQIRRAASHTVPVLLRGATGTGKELVARAIHRAGPRSDKAYVTFNLGAVPPSLAAAELFGAARGAYTGASRERPGYFRQAHGGTLFLDEVGETPAEVQPLLLRALENGEIQPVGAAHTQRVDVRFLAATDAALEQAIAEGRFKAPLLHRLGSFEILLPPLCRRRDDIGRLLVHFLRRELEELGATHLLEPAGPRTRPWLPAAAVARMTHAPWPGNVRQLRNAARQIAITAYDGDTRSVQGVIDSFLQGEGTNPSSAHFPQEVRSERTEKPRAVKPPTSYRQPCEISDHELLAALRAHSFRLKPTAAHLGVSRTSLYKLIDDCTRIRRATEVDREELEASRARNGGDLDLMAAELEVSRHGLQRRLRELHI